METDKVDNLRGKAYVNFINKQSTTQSTRNWPKMRGKKTREAALLKGPENEPPSVVAARLGRHFTTLTERIDPTFVEKKPHEQSASGCLQLELQSHTCLRARKKTLETVAITCMTKIMGVAHQKVAYLHKSVFQKCHEMQWQFLEILPVWHIAALAHSLLLSFLRLALIALTLALICLSVTSVGKSGNLARTCSNPC